MLDIFVFMPLPFLVDFKARLDGYLVPLRLLMLMLLDHHSGSRLLDER